MPYFGPPYWGPRGGPGAPAPPPAPPTYWGLYFGGNYFGADYWGPAAGAAGEAPPPPGPLGTRDRKLLRAVAARLAATGQFGLVTTSGLPESAGQSAEHLAVASLELRGFTEETLASDYAATAVLRTVTFALHVQVRHPDPDARDDEADRLYCVAANALNGQSIASTTFCAKTYLKAGEYAEAAAPERRLRCLGTFGYEIDDWGLRDTTG